MVEGRRAKEQMLREASFKNTSISFIREDLL
jgi:hypothetical protein